MLVIYRMQVTDQIWALNSIWFKILQFNLFLKNIYFRIWVPISEERKSNFRNPYLGVLVRIEQSLYSGGSTPTSGSASAYAGSGLASSFASESESTISPIINLN
jgi:hypothetical protein